MLKVSQMKIHMVLYIYKAQFKLIFQDLLKELSQDNLVQTLFGKTVLDLDISSRSYF